VGAPLRRGVLEEVFLIRKLGLKLNVKSQD
jgi:hypothetical protein